MSEDIDQLTAIVVHDDHQPATKPDDLDENDIIAQKPPPRAPLDLSKGLSRRQEHPPGLKSLFEEAFYHGDVKPFRFLLDFKEHDTGADGMQGAGRNKDHIASLDRPAVQ